jgi:uridine kinase
VPSLLDVVMVQIDGLSGTGKSTLCAELGRQGHRAVDADAMFGHFADPTTGLPSDVECRANWMWDSQKLRAFARESHDGLVFICGGAMNQNEFVDLFTIRFMLRIDSDTMRTRLLTRTNNDYGKSPEDLAEQLELNKHVVEDAERIGSTVVDATRPITEIADDIMRLARSSG